MTARSYSCKILQLYLDDDEDDDNDDDDDNGDGDDHDVDHGDDHDNLYNFDDEDKGDREGGNSQEQRSEGDQMGANVRTLVTWLLIIIIVIFISGSNLCLCLCPRWTLCTCPPKDSNFFESFLTEITLQTGTEICVSCSNFKVQSQ